MSEYDAFVRERVREYYDHVRSGGGWATIRRKLGGRSRALLDLQAITTTHTLRGQHAIGVQTVPIDQIAGSDGRCADFDADFRPLQEHTRARWEGIAAVMLADADLPPVELIQVGEVYFVRDGHHRISVSRALGRVAIDAVVTIWRVDEPLPCATVPAPRHPWLAAWRSRRAHRAKLNQALEAA
jgi:hypothetical protein